MVKLESLFKPVKKYRLLILFTGFFLLFLLIPAPTFKKPSSTLLLSREGHLLGAKIAPDGQWRFPEHDSVPFKFEKAILLFEDKNFYYHPGVDLLALGRAMYLNMKEMKIVSGGSTLSMQIARLTRDNKPRTIIQKLIEIVLAFRLELSKGKDEILAMYVSNAPFGGNVVGLETAAWRYYGRSAKELSWAESATLAVLPNAPSLIHPGKNRNLLLAKRNRLLERMLEKKIIDSITYTLSIDEPLPGEPLPLPMHAPHLLEKCNGSHPGKIFHSSIDFYIQQRANEIVANHQQQLIANKVYNSGLLIVDNDTKEILAYVGNAPSLDECHGNDVDVIMAPRSTGSILKPLLFANMLDKGELITNQLVPDIPTRFDGFHPVNYNKTYDGAVPASKALVRSLNVPAVRLLQTHGLEKFHGFLKKVGFTTIDFHPDHYGLSLILGGAEVTLWDLCRVYSSMARTLNFFTLNSSMYPTNGFDNISHGKPGNNPGMELQEYSLLGAGAIWLTFESMVEVERPVEESSWRAYTSGNRIAWKTGTSYGNRDAWAVGVTRNYTVGVWTGNADGEGRDRLTGSIAAAPLLFEIFRLLPDKGWFNIPYDDLKMIKTCKQSGHIAGATCPEIDTVYAPNTAIKTRSCPFHYLLHLTPNYAYRVNANCFRAAEIKHVPWFILPPAMQFYFKKRDPGYKEIPPMKPGCKSEVIFQQMEFIYPANNRRMVRTRNIKGQVNEIILEIAHREEGAKVYWHMDETYLGATSFMHQMPVDPAPGTHQLFLVDEKGATLQTTFEIVENN
jgi:penicillin-binding protein 1C